MLAHLFALGWGTAVALGAWPQLATVALQSAGSLRPGLVKGSLAAYLLGLPLMLFAMARGEYAWVAVGGGAVATAVLLSLLTSLPGIRRGERNSVMLAFAAPAFLSLFLVALVGVVLAINRVTGWLGPSWYQTIAAHLYLGPVGWFGLLIPGVSYELAPFFGLTKTRGEPGRGRRHRLVAIILATGLLGGLISALFGAFHPVWLGVTASGYLIFLVDLKAVYGKRPFERRTATLTGVRAAHAHLLLLALWLAWESLMQAGLAGPGYATASALRRWTLFGWFAAAGWLSNSIVAYLHRILPFLIWHSRYWGKPKEEIKTGFPRMVDQSLGRVALWVYNAGAAGAGLGLWFRADAVLVPSVIAYAAGTWILVFNLGRAYFR